jgi:hypothetical protein
MGKLLSKVGTGGVALLLLLGLPAVTEAQIWVRPVIAPPAPPPAKVTFYTPSGPVDRYVPTVPLPAVRYSFYEQPGSPVATPAGIASNYPPVIAGPSPHGTSYYQPIYYYPPSYNYPPGSYFRGYYTPGYFRY